MVVKKANRRQRKLCARFRVVKGSKKGYYDGKKRTKQHQLALRQHLNQRTIASRVMVRELSKDLASPVYDGDAVDFQGSVA